MLATDMTRPAFVRARRPEHKEQRRAAILQAAREQAAASGVRNVSLGTVAEAVGLAKSNLMRYFGSREEIFLQLAADEWRLWDEDVTARLPAADRRAVAVILAETLAARPLMCDLVGHSSNNLEHNVSVPAAREFKHTLLSVTADLGRKIAPACGLTDTEGAELVGGAAGLAAMLYPAANPPPTMVEVYAQDPELAAACPVLVPTLVRALHALAIGLPALRDEK
jgi:AcrR family transcriptional regulator